MNTTQEIIERLLDELEALGAEIEDDQYVYIARAGDAIRDLASELGIEVGYSPSI